MTPLPKRALVVHDATATATLDITRLFDDVVLVDVGELRQRLSLPLTETCVALAASAWARSVAGPDAPERLDLPQVLELLSGCPDVTSIVLAVDGPAPEAQAVPAGWSTSGRLVEDGQGLTAIVFERASNPETIDLAEVRRRALSAGVEPAHLLRSAAAMTEAARARRAEARAVELEAQLERAQQKLASTREALTRSRAARRQESERLSRLRNSPLGSLAQLSERVQRHGRSALTGSSRLRRAIWPAGLAAVGLALVVLASWLTSSGYPGAVATALVLLVGLDLLLGRRARAATDRDLRRARASADARARAQKERLNELRRLARATDRRLAASADQQSRVERHVELIAATTTDVAASLPREATPDQDVALEGFVRDHLLQGATQRPDDPSGALRETGRAVVQQVQALVDLFTLVQPRRPVPPLGGWAASSDAMLLLVDELLQLRPARVVECGSGSSTLWLALTVARFGLPTRIVALEHSEEFRQQTVELLTAHGVEHLAEVRLAPLQPVGLAGHDTPWYSREAWEDLADVGLLFVDGPPERTGPLARLPAVPLLRHTFAPRVTIVLDDTIRADETAITKVWAGELADFTLEMMPFEKGAAVFRRRSPVLG